MPWPAAPKTDDGPRTAQDNPAISAETARVCESFPPWHEACHELGDDPAAAQRAVEQQEGSNTLSEGTQ